MVYGHFKKYPKFSNKLILETHIPDVHMSDYEEPFVVVAISMFCRQDVVSDSNLHWIFLGVYNEKDFLANVMGELET